MKEKIFCITDFETTGTDPAKDYPIEIGCIFADKNFNLLGTYSNLIRPNNLRILFNKKGEWKKEYLPAFKIHKIKPKEIQSKGITYQECCSQLLDIINKIKKNNEKIIILSDNAYFEMSFMKKLFLLANLKDKFPFHYCAYDTNLSLCVFSNIGDALLKHRAIEDALLLHNQILKYLKLNNIKEGKWKK